jgi:DNA-binding response OmpR family regulator
MNSQTHPSVILLMGNSAEAENSSVRFWLEQSRFNTREAADILQALDFISDFTDRERPDVVLLEVDSPAEDFKRFRNLFDCDNSTAIFALTDEGVTIDDEEERFEGDLDQFTSQLEKLIPLNMSVVA